MTDPRAVTAFAAAAADALTSLDVLVNSAGIREIVPVLGSVAGGMEPGHRRQPDGHLPLLAGLRAPPRGGRQTGQHRQPRLDPRRQRGAEPGRLYGLQAWSRRPDPGDGDGVRRGRHPRQRGRPGGDPHTLDGALLPGPRLRRADPRYPFLEALGRSQEVAKAILFLASDDASFCTGTTLMVDGGWTAARCSEA